MNTRSEASAPVDGSARVGNYTCPKCLAAHPSGFDCTLRFAPISASPPVIDEGVVEKLRALAERQSDERGDMLTLGEPDPEIIEAIAALEAGCAEMERERDALQSALAETHNERAEMEMENARLREALSLMPDEIEIFRIMQAEGGPRAKMAKAVGRRIEEMRTALRGDREQGEG